ncbi:Glycosyltransferase involved in cell wall bisynthesis [Yoonia rosea]|uniref:Glycosyltransferase involved in cell wall bisynthesis n=1 Tax=Yoonia rosea TaxID=287098 RepID=A0A1R3XHT9_9RHOB|nr:glycosyltransferase family 4 protein [Yoonia rosea]SIT90385.1 Glycosyltransferase involved in cell wall bisynthesis [Yoonia rosea]
MKIVQVVFENPTVNGTGGDLRNIAISTALETLCEVNVISVQDAQPEGRVYPKRKKSFIELRLVPSLVENIVQRVLRYSPDLVIIEGVLIADVMERLIAEGCRVILDMHNVESLLQEQIDRSKYGLLAWVRRAHRWRAARAADARLATLASRVWVCSASDAAHVKALIRGRAQIDVIPNPVPAWCFDHPPRAGLPDGDPVALFVGHLGYRPNIEACKRLLTQIFPALLCKVPTAKLIICGRTPHPDLRTLAADHPQVQLLADPETLSSIYDSATAVLIPLSQGGGTRLKVLEAMARRVPIIASAKAVEGLNVVPGQHYLAAETNTEFAAAFQTVVENPVFADNIVTAAQDCIEKDYGKARFSERIKHAISLPSSY